MTPGYLDTSVPGYVETGAMPERYFTVPFELGKVVVHINIDGSVNGIHFDLDGTHEDRPAVSKLSTLLSRYFEGREVNWDVHLGFEGFTAFKRRVYQRVAGIPYGRTATYGEIAADVGSKGGARAVGQAMASNRYPIIVPCHRVIAGGMGIGGFSSGVDLKRYLLRLEGVIL